MAQRVRVVTPDERVVTTIRVALRDEDLDTAYAEGTKGAAMKEAALGRRD
jgi:hypothetical protein